MKTIAQRIQGVPHKQKIFAWFKLVAITGSAQVIVQAVGLISGIIIIRLLPMQEYGLYTLANTMLGTMTLLSDGGISIGVMAEGGKTWQDKEKLGVVVATGLELRRKFAIGSIIVSSPVLIYLLVHHGASWITSLLIVASLVPAFYAALSDSLLEVSPKLHQNILPLQKNQIGVGVGRLLLSGLTLLVFPFTFVAILAAGIPRIYGNLKLRKISNAFADKNQLPDAQVRKEILVVVKRILPGAVYYCLSGQITIWLISVFGNTTAVAQLGAIGRISVFLNLLSVVIVTLIIPRFARLKMDKKEMLRYYLGAHIFLSFICLVIIFLSYFFSSQLLWILGKHYGDLHNEILLSIINGCMALIIGLSFSLYSSRGWIINPLLAIPINILIIILVATISNLSSVKGVLYFNLILNISNILINFSFGFYKLLRLKT